MGDIGFPMTLRATSILGDVVTWDPISANAVNQSNVLFANGQFEDVPIGNRHRTFTLNRIWELN